MENEFNKPKVKIIGVGGSGINIINSIYDKETDLDEYIKIDKINSSSIGVDFSNVNLNIIDPGKITDNEFKSIKSKILDTDILIICGVFGGYTASNLIPLIAELAVNENILTIVTAATPFTFEGKYRKDNSEIYLENLNCIKCIKFLTKAVDLLPSLKKDVSLKDAFDALNKSLFIKVKELLNLVLNPGLVNIDHQDLNKLNSYNFVNFMHSTGIGEKRVLNAFENLFNTFDNFQTTLNQNTVHLVSITAGMDMTIGEYEETGDILKNKAGNDSIIIVGSTIDMDLQNEIGITIFSANPDNISTKSEIDFYKKFDSNSIKIIAPKNFSDSEIANLITHLSNIYKSVGGDELEIDEITNFPPRENKYLYVSKAAKK